VQSETNAVAAVLMDPENSDLSAEEVAERAIAALDGQRAKTHNLIVVGRFAFPEQETFQAAVGPLSTRASKAAISVGERFAWDYKSKTGTGRFMLLPLLRDPGRAWDYARTQRAFPDEIKDDLETMVSNQLPPCCCGAPLERHPSLTSAGDRITVNVCPRHPEGRHA
jgi:hypothetical protein